MYPTYRILPEMFEQCVPELRGAHSEIAKGFVKDLMEPYQKIVLENIADSLELRWDVKKSQKFR